MDWKAALARISIYFEDCVPQQRPLTLLTQKIWTPSSLELQRKRHTALLKVSIGLVECHAVWSSMCLNYFPIHFKYGMRFFI